jgi:hypothetical protein
MDWNDPEVKAELAERGFSDEDQKYLRIYSEGFIDAADVIGLVELGDRSEDKLRHLARNASTLALAAIVSLHTDA